MRWVAAAVVLAGCDLVFGLDNAPDATVADAAVTTDANRACLVDSFDSTMIDPEKWVVLEQASPHAVTANGNELQIALASFIVDDAYNGIGSVATYDLTDATLEVFLVSPSNQVGWSEADFDVVNARERIVIAVGAGTINFARYLDGTEDRIATSYGDGTDFRYWRMRHTSNPPTMHLEASADGNNWSEYHTVPTLDATAMNVRLFAGTFQGGANPELGIVRFDDFSLARVSCD